MIDSDDSQSKDKLKVHGHIHSTTADSLKILTYRFNARTLENGNTSYHGFNMKKPEMKVTLAKSDIYYMTVYRNKEAYRRRELARISGAALLFTGFVSAASAFVVPNDESRDPLFILAAFEALLGFGLVIPLSKREYQFKPSGHDSFVEPK